MELSEAWQDWVLAIGQIFFLLALLPSVFSSDKPSKYSSAPTAMVLYLFSYTFYTLGLTWGAITSFLVGVIWTVLFFQKLKQ